MWPWGRRRACPILLAGGAQVRGAAWRGPVGAPTPQASRWAADEQAGAPGEGLRILSRSHSSSTGEM